MLIAAPVAGLLLVVCTPVLLPIQTRHGADGRPGPAGAYLRFVSECPPYVLEPAQLLSGCLQRLQIRVERLQMVGAQCFHVDSRTARGR
ncbi:hypothetical protein [Streptomyces sp. NPDC048496]|uniref:hypothetical protein n=1 Tax=Streptomyces sp. NPDC048496 TaxID=3365558 RepID=UPI00371244D4